MSIAQEPVVVPASPLEAQLKGQARIVIAAIAGALVLRNLLPAFLVNDQMIELVTGVVMLGLASVWSWVRAKFNWLRLFKIADNPKTPDSVAQVAK